ncbi:hypothetical protein CC86DRAFT_200573 [Ophiobolus disseminans]|uniref:Uncharacterized protein n=1 Tax=Ophiobolus disseminans TaxID=1469910 RepID=A0A6A7A3W0_9PLEO|nr:hypothetical protein CC86DRAFT_200573 [Ophiobolus disseminans]
MEATSKKNGKKPKESQVDKSVKIPGAALASKPIVKAPPPKATSNGKSPVPAQKVASPAKSMSPPPEHIEVDAPEQPWTTVEDKRKKAPQPNKTASISKAKTPATATPSKKAKVSKGVPSPAVPKKTAVPAMPSGKEMIDTVPATLKEQPWVNVTSKKSKSASLTEENATPLPSSFEPSTKVFMNDFRALLHWTRPLRKRPLRLPLMCRLPRSPSRSRHRHQSKFRDSAAFHPRRTRKSAA